MLARYFGAWSDNFFPSFWTPHCRRYIAVHAWKQYAETFLQILTTSTLPHCFLSHFVIMANVCSFIRAPRHEYRPFASSEDTSNALARSACVLRASVSILAKISNFLQPRRAAARRVTTPLPQHTCAPQGARVHNIMLAF
jgi:hypothetical protein